MAHRYTVNVNEEIDHFLVSYSKKKHQSISSIIQELINEAIELREDFYWSKVANEAEKRAKGQPTIPAEVLWKELGLQ